MTRNTWLTLGRRAACARGSVAYATRLTACLTGVHLLLVVGAGAPAAAGEGRKPSLAVMPLEAKAGVSMDLARVLDGWLYARVFGTGRFVLVNRQDLDRVVRELNCQQSTLSKCYVEAGNALRAEKLLVGEIAKVGETFLLGLRLVNAKEFRDEFVDAVHCTCTEDKLLDKVTALVDRMVGGMGPTDAGGVGSSVGVRREGSRLIREKDGAEILLVPAGPFRMGSTPAEIDAAKALARDWDLELQDSWYALEGPPHEVELSPFYIDRHELTNERYSRFVRETGRQPPTRSGDARGNVWTGSSYPEDLAQDPVVNVSWADASDYCAWAGARLPTEAEWEKAARGTDGRVFPWGNIWDDARANRGRTHRKKKFSGDSADGYEFISPVGSFQSGASPYGALDMAGNVQEWVEDWFNVESYKFSQARDPVGPPTGQYRVTRGGSCLDPPVLLRASYRFFVDPTSRRAYVGFRCAQDAE